jgi:hypothetical protein
MRWRYSLYDRSGNGTRIEEPIGWDAFSLKIKRHAERHGTFREVQTNQFQFTGKAAELLRDEYELYGIRGKYEMKIDGKCAGKTWITLYRGQVSFDAYSFKCEKGSCLVTVGLDQVGPVVDFINRFDQKVDVSSLLAFDGTTALTNYSQMVQDLLVPSKAILLRASSTNNSDLEYILSDDAGWIFPGGTGNLQGSISIPLQSTDTNAIKDYNPSSLIDFYNFTQNQEYVPELIYNNPVQPLNCSGAVFTLDFRVKGQFKNLVTGSGTLNLRLLLKKGTANFIGSPTTLQHWSISTLSSGTLGIYTTSFDHSFAGDVYLAPGEKLWLDFLLDYNKTTSFAPDVRIVIEPETYFKAQVTSKCDPTTVKLFMINETASRVIEAITNNELKLYSEYYGRTDSQPFNFATEGCGGRRAVTTGLNIRKAKMADGSEPKFFLSMKDIFESLSAIDNVGVGWEGGNIRMENWKYFYQDDILLTCTNIGSVQKTVKGDLHISVFKNGYDKWEAEDYNGLDEFLTKREWRTDISQVQNTLEKVSKWIASGYAWEVTRRKQNDTKDWRFDNDTFVICLSNSYFGVLLFGSSNTLELTTSDLTQWQFGDIITIVTGTGVNNGTYTITSSVLSGGAVLLTLAGSAITPGILGGVIHNEMRQWVEAGNMVFPANILDPATVLNFRISPERNAMRWFDFIAACYRNITNSDKVIFTSGTGNFLAEGQIVDACTPEAAAIAENADISLDKFADPVDATPIIANERVSFTYPLGFEDYRRIADQPYGIIAYESDCERGEGWIEEIEYIPEEGEAKFTLIPKIPT